MNEGMENYAVDSANGREFCSALRFALHLGPIHIARYINGPFKLHIPPSRTYVHPGFIASRMIFMTDTRAAPIEQRTRLL